MLSFPLQYFCVSYLKMVGMELPVLFINNEEASQWLLKVYQEPRKPCLSRPHSQNSNRSMHGF